ncbi:ubiquitin carboxyl-terminal hydrolase 31-like isoform X1 [Brienomyrus brachyistius]|uniref:ubiquitin carboxyl-terminal hydrolase 31-like isoform X1 n=1 Tax=Brienomyrus brachyistius TaxID=42636 RepID=UPI0020B2E32B|nr:ubiquitin carboxyl-terminal hydrolase 31-like isoform X1 [Brienomyrus brachyistius]
MSKAATKEKKSFSKKLFQRGSVRSVGSFMNRVLRTLSTLSHFGTEEHSTENEKDDGGFTSFKTGAAVPSDRSDGGSCSFLFGDKVPGVSGLKNHGNTCFMNAILQCLSNTELFAEYLALEQYRGEDKDDKSKANGVFLPRKTSQGKGEVTEQLSGLVRALWTFEYTPQHSREFKNVVSKSATQFRGNSQHDAQEFLLWLLDRVHEDLNILVNPSCRTSVKPPLEDSDAASEGSSLAATGSFVQELFQAQYRSSLTCPHCQKQSNTFDPFLCISLPIPLPHTRPLYVTVVYQGKRSHCMRIGVAVPLKSTVSRLRDAVSMETKIPSDQIVLTEMYYDGFHRSFCDDDEDLDIIQESDSIFAFETPEIFRPENIRAQRGSLHANLNQNNLKHGTDHNRTSSYMQGAVKPASGTNKNVGGDKIILLVCNRACTGHQGRRFGHPFVLYLERTVTWDVLQKEILEKMRHLHRPGVYVQVGPFSLRVVGVAGIAYLLPQEEQPLCHPSVDRVYKSCGPGGPPHVKIVVEWDKETKDYLFGHTEDEYIPDAESVRLQVEQHSHPQVCTLAQCFQLYTKEEQLAPDDAWRCPHCKQLQQGSIKLSLWTLPDILILHLKRFRQDRDRRMKIQNMVKFPLVGMDMAPHMVKRSQSSWSLPSHWSPWRRPYGRDPEDYLYDLYAVCNHHGTMQGGHYTAYCKNSIDGQWYCFDDSDVQLIPDEDVCKEMAYILFYQRRATIPSWSANSSVAGSTSSSLCEHWVNRLPGSKQPSVASAASSRRTSLISLSESVEFAGERSEDDECLANKGSATMLRGFSTRPFVRSVQRQSLSSRSSIASPLAVSENGTKPSWSLSAKLQMRSNSPSRFSLDSHSSPTLERIGEAGDDKVSTSCFGSYSKHERHSSGKAPLAVMDGTISDDGGGKRSLDEAYCKAPSQSDKRSSKAEPDIHNQATPVDHAASKEPKHRSSSVPKSEGTTAKRSSCKAAVESEKSSRRRHTASSAQNSPASQVSSSPHIRSSTKAPSSKDKNNSSKTGKASSGTPAKKEPSHGQEAVLSAASQHRQRLSSTPQSSASPSPTRRKISSGAERSSASGRSRLAERSASQDLTRASTSAEKLGGAASRPGCAARTSLAHSSDGRRPEGRTVRSSSSSSSVTSLRSSSVSSRDLRRNSKSEDKGLSFFKSALRQKETRRSADFGKTAILAKKVSDGTAKSSPEIKNGTAGAGEGSGKTGQQMAPEPQPGKESFKTCTPVRNSVLSAGKSKSSMSETTQSLGSGRKPADKTGSSRNLSSSTQSPARATQKPH